jgi:hypothetical protein
MKKLMIALGAAASMAWCANADVVSAVAGGTFVSGTDFNGLTADTTLTKAEEGGVVFWKSVADELSSTIKEKVAGDNYLAVDETEVLERTMNGVNGTPQSLLTSSVYFTADVQFTASDETSGADMITTGDKLLVWLRATEAVEAVMNGDEIVTPAVPATTNLIITAASGAAGTGATDYIVDSSVVIDPARWYKLTIKAVKDGIENYETAKFTVELDGKPLSATAAGAESATTTFNSLVGSGDGASATITSVGFKGTGALDNLEFGTFTEVAQTFTATVTVNDSTAPNSATITVDDDQYVSPVTNANLVVGTTTPIVIVVTDELQEEESTDSTLAVTCEQATPVWDSDEGTWTITVDVSQVAAGATYPIVVNVAAAGSTPTTDFPSAWNGGVKPSSKEILDKYATWAKDNNPTDEGAEVAFLLNIASDADDKTLAVNTIVVEGGKVKITSNRNLKDVNGVPYILTGDEPNAVNNPAEATVDKDGNIEYQPGNGETKKFYKIGVGYAVPAAPAAQEPAQD